jgi:hypothetical protein
VIFNGNAPNLLAFCNLCSHNSYFPAIGLHKTKQLIDCC